MTGTVIQFERSYGFIRPEGGGRSVFVHYTGISDDGFRSLVPGQEVEFEVEPTDRGPKAVGVVVIGDATHGEDYAQLR